MSFFGRFLSPAAAAFLCSSVLESNDVRQRKEEGNRQNSDPAATDRPTRKFGGGRNGGLLLLLRIEEKELHFWDLRLNHGERRGSRLDFASVVGGMGGGDTDAIVWEEGFDVSTFRELEGALGLVLSFFFCFFLVGIERGQLA